jgi:hypothetical protein
VDKSPKQRPAQRDVADINSCSNLGHVEVDVSEIVDVVEVVVAVENGDNNLCGVELVVGLVGSHS